MNMMEQLWQWLMRANARGVFVIALLALLLASAWWVREEVRTHDIPVPPGRKPPATTHKPAVRLDVLDTVQRQLGVNPEWVPDTPFRPALGDRRRRPTDPIPEPIPGTAPDPAGGTPDTVARPPRGAGDPAPGDPGDPDAAAALTDPVTRPRFRPGQVPAGDPMTVVTLVYRGLFTRSDGSQLALMEDQERGRRAFHPVGTDLYGLRLDAVSSSAVAITTADGATIELPIGQAVDFSEGMPLHE